MAKWDHGEELKMDQQNFPQTPIVPASFGLQAEVILRLLVLKLDAHLEAAAEKSCSVFWERILRGRGRAARPKKYPFRGYRQAACQISGLRGIHLCFRYITPTPICPLVNTPGVITSEQR